MAIEQNTTEREELAEIYNSLSRPLKDELMTLARVISETRDIVFSEIKADNSFR